MAEAIGIVFSCYISCFTLLFKEASERTIITTDIETKVTSDLNDKLHGIAELAIARPEVAEILDRESADMSPKESAAMYMFYTSMHMDFIYIRGEC